MKGLPYLCYPGTGLEMLSQEDSTMGYQKMCCRRGYQRTRRSQGGKKEKDAEYWCKWDPWEEMIIT